MSRYSVISVRCVCSSYVVCLRVLVCVCFMVVFCLLVFLVDVFSGELLSWILCG